ncbi:PilZ domain-containing protein [Gracilibacillus xinjiangensis]|uniref:PilZ domain-containing protein n=1 Tax=Gracilibacillus xinjiangensis TaxID=1193282 RepID=A0ABV8WZ16_9BACI
MHIKREEAFRYKFKQPIIGTASLDNSREFKMQIINVSPKGMKIQTNNRISKNTPIYIKYNLLEESFQVNGKIVWSLDTGGSIQHGIVLEKSEDYHTRLILALKKVSGFEK